MKKFLASLTLLIFLTNPLQVFGAVTFGNWMGGTVAGGSSGVLFAASVTATSTTPAIVCTVRYNSATVSVSALVWDQGTDGLNSFALTQLGTYNFLDSSNARMSLWYLLSADQSNTRIKLTNSGSADTYISCSHFSGVATSNAFTTASNVANTSDTTSADTSDRTGSLHIGGASSGNGGLGVTGGVTVEGSIQSGNTDVVYATANTDSGSHTLSWLGGGSAGTVTAMMRPPAAAATWQAQTYVLIQDWEN